MFVTGTAGGCNARLTNVVPKDYWEFSNNTSEVTKLPWWDFSLSMKTLPDNPSAKNISKCSCGYRLNAGDCFDYRENIYK